MTQATTTAVFFFCFFFNDVVTYWTMIRTHVVPDSSTMGTHQLHLTWFTYNCYNTESYTPQPVDPTPIPQLLPYMQSFSFGQHVIYQTK